MSKTILYLIKNRFQIFRFGIVGAITFILNFSLVWSLYGLLELNYPIAVTLAYIITVIAHFLLNRYFTYKADNSSVIGHIGRYGVMLMVNYLVTVSISIVTVELFKLTPYHGVIFATGMTAFLSFLIMKYFVFSERR